MRRELRLPPAQAEFDRIAIPTPAPVEPLPRFRLGNPAYASQFYPNPASRLTPLSLKFPCAYLGATRETAIAEVWGDRFWKHREAKLGIFVIAKGIATASVFLEVKNFPMLKLCDLTRPDVRLALGLESGTLYSPDLALPQTWAERIARHPAAFDGILYRSRITEEKCVVLWIRPDGRRLDRKLLFPQIAPFHNAPEAFSVAQKCGVRLAFER